MLAPHRKGKGSNIKVPARVSSEAAPGAEDGSSSATIVLPSSTDLFYFYAQSLEQCAKLSTGQALFDLCTVHKKWLRIYAGKLWTSIFCLGILMMPFIEEILAVEVKRYDKLNSYLTRNSFLLSRPVATSRKSTESRADLDLLKQICLSINTADYCQSTALEVLLILIRSQNCIYLLSSLRKKSKRRSIRNSRRKSLFRLNVTYSSGKNQVRRCHNSCRLI